MKDNRDAKEFFRPRARGRVSMVFFLNKDPRGSMRVGGSAGNYLRE